MELSRAWVGNPRTEKELGNLIRAQDQSILFLVETLKDESSTLSLDH